MQALERLTLTQTKLYLREPAAAFFTLIFPTMLLVIFGMIYGNEPTSHFNGHGMVDVQVPAYIALVMLQVSFMSVPIGVATNRESGVLRRYRATPLRPLTYLVAEVVMYFGMILLGVMLLLVAGKVGYNVRFEGNLFSMLAGLTLAGFAFLSCGYLIASLAPTARIAQAVGMVVSVPMMFLSGATLPLEELPPNILAISQFIPLTHAVTLLRGLWAGDGFEQHLVQLAVLGGLLIVGALVSARSFRWE